LVLRIPASGLLVQGRCAQLEAIPAMKPSYFLVGALLFSVIISSAASAELIAVRRVWDAAPHNAFTDLIRHRGEWFMTFREGSGHVATDGSIRVLASGDGTNWSSAALIKMPGQDLRDSKLSVMPDGRLHLLTCGANRITNNGPAAIHQTMAAISANGRDWSALKPVADPNVWLWRLTWHGPKAYGISYDTGKRSPEKPIASSRLWSTDDGLNFSVVAQPLLTNGHPTEATLAFQKDGTALCLQRHDGPAPSHALLGTAKPPYTSWTWRDLGTFFGGPHFIQIPDGRWIACGRIHGTDAKRTPKTVVCELDVAAGKLVPLLTLPSGGDTSYPGLAWHEGRLWISYYSSHEGKTSVYLAEVALGQ
jgi:hypothetical protein